MSAGGTSRYEGLGAMLSQKKIETQRHGSATFIDILS